MRKLAGDGEDVEAQSLLFVSTRLFLVSALGLCISVSAKLMLASWPIQYGYTSSDSKASPAHTRRLILRLMHSIQGVCILYNSPHFRKSKSLCSVSVLMVQTITVVGQFTCVGKTLSCKSKVCSNSTISFVEIRVTASRLVHAFTCAGLVFFQASTSTSLLV